MAFNAAGFLNKKELATRYRVSSRTLNNWMRRGLPVAKIGRVLVFNVQSCDNWVNSFTQ